jgi:hypothetical protein
VLAVLCSRHDASAQAFARRHAYRDVHALTCVEVSQPGWRLNLNGPAGSTKVELAGMIAGRHLAGRQITGLITRLPAVTEDELQHIVPEDRSYVAAEMHAFLFAFLAALPCPIVNPPSPACLCGPNLREVQWRKLVRELRIPLPEEFAGGRAIAAATPETMSEVAVIKGRTIGAEEESLRRWTRALAQGAGLPYLRVRYSYVRGIPCFVGADPRPHLESEKIADALLESFPEKAPSC